MARPLSQTENHIENLLEIKNRGKSPQYPHLLVDAKVSNAFDVDGLVSTYKLCTSSGILLYSAGPPTC